MRLETGVGRRGKNSMRRGGDLRREDRALERKLRSYGGFPAVFEVPEAQLIKAVHASQQAFYEGEYGGVLTRTEFLFWQISYIKKRWWLLQALVLAALWGILYASGSGYYIQRGMGVLAPVFAVLLIPELWKNRTSDSMEIEGASYFNLQQIYAARMFAFGMVDVILLSVFCAAAVMTCRLPLDSMLVHFFLPLTVAASICYRTLCSRWCCSGYFAVILCLFWIAVWTLIVLDGNLYDKLSRPVWYAVLLAAAAYLFCAVSRAWKSCQT